MKKFITAGIENKNFWGGVMSIILAIAFFVVATGCSMVGGAFMITLSVIMCIAGVVSLIFFFIALACLFEEIT